jgi:hypothetical protein
MYKKCNQEGLMITPDQKDKFAIDEYTGVRKLTAIGCFERHNRTREEMYMTKKESMIRNLETSNQAEREERIFTNYLAKGYRPFEDEPIEEFITRCEESEE